MRAKSEERARARQLRLAGMTYDEIALQLGISKSSCSLWLRDLPAPSRSSPEARLARFARDSARYREGRRRDHERLRSAELAAAAAEVGRLSERDVRLLGAVAYWAEGTKSKQNGNRRTDRLAFVNGDPVLIQLFDAWLDLHDVGHERRSYRLHLHRGRDETAAQAHWQRVLARPLAFASTVWKVPKPATRRRNTGAGYHGLLATDVRGSAELYRRIEGIVEGIVGAAESRSSTR